jgi:hypothetical protein
VVMLEVAWRRCDRRGKLRLARLIAEHGADISLPELRTILAGDCPHARSDRSTTSARCISRSCRGRFTASSGEKCDFGLHRFYRAAKLSAPKS